MNLICHSNLSIIYLFNDMVKLPSTEDSDICSYVMVDICFTLKKVPNDSEVELLHIKMCVYSVENHRANELYGKLLYLPRSSEFRRMVTSDVISANATVESTYVVFDSFKWLHEPEPCCYVQRCIA